MVSTKGVTVPYYLNKIILCAIFLCIHTLCIYLGWFFYGKRVTLGIMLIYGLFFVTPWHYVNTMLMCWFFGFKKFSLAFLNFISNIGLFVYSNYKLRCIQVCICAFLLSGIAHLSFIDVYTTCLDYDIGTYQMSY